MLTRIKSTIRRRHTKLRTATLALVYLLSAATAWAGESDPLSPSRHSPKGPDSGPINCSMADATSTVATCQNDIRYSEAQIERFTAHHRSLVAGDGDDGFLKLRMSLTRKIQDDRAVIRLLRLSAPGAGALKKLLGPRAAEIHKANQVWSGVEVNTAPYTAPSDYIGIYQVSGSFKVPALYVPDTKSGLCDGKNDKNYAISWWIGIGGDPNGSIYQAGVNGVIVCSAGSTTPAITYRAWEECFPFQDVEVDLPGFSGKIKAGDTINVTISSNFNKEPTQDGIMTYTITDGPVTSGTKNIKDNNYAPYKTAEAVVERAVESARGPPYYYSLPGTSSQSTMAMFTGLTYDLAYQTNANTGNPIKFSFVTGLNLNRSVGSGARCSAYNNWCVGAFLNDLTSTECDAATGSGPNTTTSGYIYAFKGEPEKDGCYTPPP